MIKRHPTRRADKIIRDTPFNPERYASSERAKEWIDSALREINEFENKNRLRQRRRKARDQKLFEEQVEALLCDTVFTFLAEVKDRTGKISLSLSRRNIGPKQGGHRLVNSTLNKTLDLLGETGIALFDVTIGSKQSGLQTTVGVTCKLGSQLEKFQIEKKDFKLRKDKPLIELRGPKVAGKRGKPLPLPESPEVSRMMRELVEINEFFSQSQIQYHGSRTDIDEGDRKIFRVFNITLTSYGQPQGGFWTSLKNEDRVDNLYIEDEPIKELDLKSASLQIAYALKGIAPLEDFYAIPSLRMLKREEIKKITLTYMNGGRSAFRHGVTKSVYKKMCPDMEEDKNRVLLRLLSEIRDHHQPIKEYFDPERLSYLAYIQGEVIMSTIVRLMNQKIAALPVGDAICVRESTKDQAIKEFQRSFEDKTNSTNKIILGS